MRHVYSYMWTERLTTCNIQPGMTKNRYHFFQTTKLDKVMVCQFRGAYEANVRMISLLLHKHKLIALQI
jgi:hypothetical protein